MNPAINSEWAEYAIAMAILAPLVGAIGIQLTGRWPNVRETVTMISAFTAFYFVQSLLPMVYGTPIDTLMPGNGAGPIEYVAIKNVLPNVDLAFQVEPLGMLYALVAAGLWIPTSLYAVGYMRGHDEDNQTRFFTCFALAIFAALGIAFARLMSSGRRLSAMRCVPAPRPAVA